MEKLLPTLLVFTGAGVGGVLRFWVSESMARPPGGFPSATLLVNTSGCLALGCLVGALPNMSPPTRLLVVVGLLGGFTTFSAFARETVDLAASGRIGVAATYVLASNTLAIGCALLGFALARRIST